MKRHSYLRYSLSILVCSIVFSYSASAQGDSVFVRPTPDSCWLLPFYEEPSFCDDRNPFGLAIDTCGFNFDSLYPYNPEIDTNDPFYCPPPPICQLGLSEIPTNTEAQQVFERIYAYMFECINMSVKRNIMDSLLLTDTTLLVNEKPGKDTVYITQYIDVVVDDYGYNPNIQYLASIANEGKMRAFIIYNKLDNTGKFEYASTVYLEFSEYVNIDSLYRTFPSYQEYGFFGILLPIIDCRDVLTSVQERPHKSSINIYPNPSGDTFSITSTFDIDSSIKCFSGDGRHVEPRFRRISDATVELDFTDLPMGMYTIIVGKQTHKVVVRR